jgi:hypothetical protein
MSGRSLHQRTVKQSITAVTGNLLQRVAVTKPPTHEVPPIVHDVLRSHGELLDAQTRAFMESHFGHEFSEINNGPMLRN